MITNVDYLIQRYSEAREKASYTDGTKYWNGVMDTYHALLNEAFPGWAESGTTGYWVFYEGLSYDAALAKTTVPYTSDDYPEFCCE